MRMATMDGEAEIQKQLALTILRFDEQDPDMPPR
jgi:hypothetical protein